MTRMTEAAPAAMLHEGAPRQHFLDAMALAATSVSLVTTAGAHGRDGVAISALASVSADRPGPLLLVCVNSCSRVAPKLLANGVFCVNLLRQDQANLADRFAGRDGTSPEYWFGDAGWQVMATGAPCLDNAIASFDCTLAETARMGSHHVIFGLVQAVRFDRDGLPLVHARRGYHHLHDPNRNNS